MSVAGDGGRAPVRIVLRPIGAPLTLGMAGLAIASLVESGVALGWTPVAQTGQAGLILIAVPFVLQIVACVLCYLARDGASGSALGILSTTWLAIGLVHLVAAPGSTSGPMGLLMLAAAGVLGLTAVAIATQKLVPAIIFGAAAARFAVAAIYQLGASTTWEHVAGIIGLVVCGLAAYALIAFELEDQRERSVLPTLRRGAGAAALADPGLDTDRILREAGVRETT